MVRTHIQLTDAQIAALKTLATQRHQSVADMIREGVERLIQSTNGSSPAERRQRALAVAGRFHSGLGDLARRHDVYVGEAFAQ